MNVNFCDIQVTKYREKLTIIPIELHWSRRTSSNGFCNDTWKRLLKRIESDPNCRVVFVGDLIDDDRPSMRAKKAVIYADSDRQSAREEADNDHRDRLDKYLIPDLKRIKDKIIGMVDGDHFRIYANGMTSTQYIAAVLKIPKAYLGERMGWIKLSFRRKKDSTTMDIFLRHGRGGTGAFGNDVNALIRQNQGFIADLYIGGHTHKQWFIKVPHLYCGRADIKQKLVGYARAGSLLRGFMYGKTTYAEIAEYNPLSIGCPEINIHLIRGDKKNNGNLYIEDMTGLT